MDLTQEVVRHWQVNTSVLGVQSDEQQQVLFAVEQAVDKLSQDRQESGNERPIMLVCHDPVSGLHASGFPARGATVKPDKVANDLDSLLAPISDQDRIDVKGYESAISPVVDIIVLLKGWGEIVNRRYSHALTFEQKFVSMTQSQDSSSSIWAEVEDEATLSRTQPWAKDGNRILARGKRMFIITGSSMDLPPSLTNEVRVLHQPLPDSEQLGRVADTTYEVEGARGRYEMPDQEAWKPIRNRIVTSMKGLTAQMAAEALSLSLIARGGLDPEGVVTDIDSFKGDFLNRLPGVRYIPRAQLLEQKTLPGYEKVSESIEDSMAIDPESAARHNLQPMKGLFFAGPPGVGKTVAAQQVAAMMGRPLLIWSMGESQSKWVSESEKQTRQVLDTAKRIGAVLMIDDVDKAGMGTGGSSTDGGAVFDRMINILLTTMSEGSDVFFVLTANRVQSVRSELYRDGRVDEQYFVDLPDSAMRRQIVEYHIAQRNFPVNAFLGKNGKKLGKEAAEMALEDFCSDGEATKPRTRSWSGAELEGLVVRAARRAVRLGQDVLDISWMLNQAAQKTPLARQKASQDDINQMRDMCSDFTVIGTSSSGISVMSTQAMGREIGG